MSRERAATVVLLAGALLATAAASAIATSMDVLVLLLALLLAVGALVIATLNPILLFYFYCAAIPFNFALPPGPAGTVARIAGLAFFLGYLIRKPDSLRPRTIPLFGWLFVAWSLVSCLWAINSDIAFRSWLTLAQLLAITVLSASLVSVNAEIARNALWTYATAAAVTALMGSISYLDGPTVFLARAAAFSGQDPAMFASLILPAAIFLMGEVQSRTTGRLARSFALAALVVCVVALALSGTRSAWIGILVATVAWLCLQRDARQILAVAVLAFGVAILVAGVPGMGEFLFGRVETSVAGGGAGRTEIWVVGLGILAAAPLIGVGFGNFAVAFTPFNIAQAPAEVAARGVLSAGRDPHNVLLGAAVEVGLVGAILLVAFLGSALRPRASDGTYVLRVILISLFVQSLFLDILLQKQLWLFLALSFGLAAATRLDAAIAPVRSWLPQRRDGVPVRH